ncbi:MAG TPA: Mur ligase family protein [Solirubrobacterales bacterium]|nr:Mur ligase family protein [Solirubrobacterales bacterium]
MSQPDGGGREAEQPSPDAYLDSLEPIGWRLGLERMHALGALLGMPQHRFSSIHVVGTNGKSSVTRMTAALLEAHGLRTGACVSPHAERWSERVLVRGEEIGAAEFAAAVERAAQAAEALNRKLPEGELVTQFELATAATFVALAAARVEVAVVEAGLGGRLDATNTMPSRVTVLTSVGLDHTEWLGESEEEIAAEKLAVLRDHSVLVRGWVSPAVAPLAEEVATERGARLVVAPEDPGAGVVLRSPGRYQRRNFAVACAAAEAFLGRALDQTAIEATAAGVSIPGRLERIADHPPVFLDAAHNPDGATALAEALSELPLDCVRTLSGLGRQSANAPAVVAVLAVLAEKDLEGIVRALAPAVDRAVCTELPVSRPSHPAVELAAACEAAGIAAEGEPNFAAAVERGRALAVELGGILVVAGSHYALAPARAAMRGFAHGPQRRI